MKKVAILLALFCMLTVTASAAYIPEDVISENRDGRQLIVKTYMLPPDADPSGLVEEPFEVEGYSYHHLETVKEEQTFEDSKIQTEVVTLETDVLLYRKNEGDTYISVKADYPVPLFTKRLRQATMHKYTVNLLTLWWMPIDEQDLQDIPGFYRRLFQESECSPASGFAMESPLSRTPK